LAALPQLEEYAGWLAGPAIDRGLLGPGEADRIWTRHLVNCALLLPLLPASGTICDLGSGAGLPGVVLAIARRDLSIVLLEPLLRRAVFLEEVVDDLALKNVTVVRDRAEDYARSHPRHDVAVARAVAPLPQLLRWALPLVGPEGTVLALKGEKAAEELAAAAALLEREGVVDQEVLTLGQGGNVTHAVRVVRPRAFQNHRATEDR
ncbi:MAG: 16S rRNA (guanine(527)-N(7))-methyltransferase RsmG, partial [Actinomycetes bacterium]